MYVYLGKLNWKGAAVADDETFIVILPNGAVRTSDTAYVFFQWTRDEYGVPKANWFQTISIDKVSKTDKGDDLFTLKHPKFSWKITSQQAYENIKVTMSDCASYETSSTLKRVWGTHSHGGKANDTVRVWTGKINWSTFAKNEMATFIAPEGFGQGRPIVSLWQWTKSYAGKAKDPSLHCEYQKIQTENDDVFRFTYTSYFDLDCTFNRQTGKLSVRMKSPQESSAKDLGDFTLAALIDRHSHDFNPPESTPNKAETEFRLPQPQPSLTRILAPMPFPRTLVETLTHAAAFIDQAGYQTKYAEQQFKTLDSKLHDSEHQLDTARKQIGDHEAKVRTLKAEVAESKGEIAALRKSLEDAKKQAATKEDELSRLIDKLSAHDITDHEKIKQLSEDLDKLKAQIVRLQEDLVTANVKLNVTDSQLQEEKQQKARLEEDLRALRDKNTILEKDNKRLTAENAELKSKNEDLEKQQKILHGQLHDATTKLKTTQCELTAKSGALKKAENERDQARAELEAKALVVKKAEEKATKAREDLDAMAGALKKVEDEIADMKKKQVEHDKLDDTLREAERKHREADDVHREKDDAHHAKDEEKLAAYAKHLEDDKKHLEDDKKHLEDDKKHREDDENLRKANAGLNSKEEKLLKKMDKLNKKRGELNSA
ncbi:RecF/RecN/SMC N terminal domain-containing protein [Colletotrichum camelliae]|nr:RecF/RecN/SMC N terminal domain-containing protein [Colletotrichum camelliae]